MAYLGRKGAVAPLTSADIPVGIVEGTDIAFLENASGTQNLGGTYSTERMYLNDSYTLTGDVTITGHLALGTVGDADVVITQDGTERTITGSGTLKTGELMNERQTSLTGMTGELGSAVTGSPNLNLGNATFPAGHVLQSKTVRLDADGAGNTATGTTSISTGLALSMTPTNSSNKILIRALAHINPPAAGTTSLDLWGGASSSLNSSNRIGSSTYGMGYQGSGGLSSGLRMTGSFEYLYTLGDAGETAGNEVFFELAFFGSGNYSYVRYQGIATFTIQEIQQ